MHIANPFRRAVPDKPLGILSAIEISCPTCGVKAHEECPPDLMTSGGVCYIRLMKVGRMNAEDYPEAVR